MCNFAVLHHNQTVYGPTFSSKEAVRETANDNRISPGIVPVPFFLISFQLSFRHYCNEPAPKRKQFLANVEVNLIIAIIVHSEWNVSLHYVENTENHKCCLNDDFKIGIDRPRGVHRIDKIASLKFLYINLIGGIEIDSCKVESNLSLFRPLLASAFVLSLAHIASNFLMNGQTATRLNQNLTMTLKNMRKNSSTVSSKY
uniref:Uncharacterized protein n=1 Tax=Glossina pallidipes TaxID=7398 RepID=A0A1A9Z4W7_GLOPL